MFSRRSVLSAVVLAIAFVPLALAQTPPRVPWNWMATAQIYLADEGLQKELNLNAEQVKKANELATTGFTRLRERSTGDEKARGEIDKAIKKDLEGFLKPEQVTRLRQVILQQLASNPRSGTALITDAEVGKVLKLTEEQQKKIQARDRLAAVMDEEQQKEWKKLVGKPYAGLLRPSGFPRFQPSLPDALRYLTAKSVADELKLAKEQRDKVAVLVKKFEKAVSQTNDTKKSRDLVTAADMAADKEARELLKPEQAKRLAQIELQLDTRGGRENAVLRDPRVVAGLKLTEKQQEKVKSTFEKRRKEMLGLFNADEEPARVIEKVQAFKKETSKQLHAVLDEKQEAALKGLIGEPFKGEVPFRFGGMGGGFGPPNTPLYTYVTGAIYLGSPDLHRELKLDAEATKKLKAFADKAFSSPGRFGLGGDEKTRKAQAEANRKEVAGILDAKQLARFEQVWLQWVGIQRGGGRPTAHRYHEVRESLKLSDDQKKKLNEGEDLARVLDGDQAKKWKQMLGEPFKGELVVVPRGGPFGQFGRALPVVLLALKTTAVRDEIKLTEDQQKKIPELEARWQQERQGGRGGSFEEFQKAQQAAEEAIDKAVAKILKAKQNARLQQIVLQDANKRGLRMVLLRPAVKAALKIEGDQLKKFDAIGKGEDDLENLLFMEYQGFGPGGRDDETQVAVNKVANTIQKKTTKRLEGELTEKQKEQLKALLGEPFEGEIERPRRGDGSGGGGGGFGFGGFPG